MQSPLYCNRVDLSGRWKLHIGAENNSTLPKFEDSITLPGSLQAQGFGDDITVDTQWTAALTNRAYYDDPRYAPYREPGNIKIPFWLQPDKHYVGQAWYQREIEIPAEWANRRIILTLERAHIETAVWLDDTEIGTQNSLGAPHIYTLGTNIAPGKHKLTIRVDSSIKIDVGTDSHSVSDHTQTNWNGIIGRIDLTSTSPVWIEDAQVFPNIADRSVRIRVQIGNTSGHSGSGILSVAGEERAIEWTTTGAIAEITHRFSETTPLWDEFTPALQTLKLRLIGNLTNHEHDITFGLREVAVDGTQIAVNGRKVFLRGTLECCVFPKTGYPPTGIAEWEHVLGTIRSYGFNHVRFHSWCPPEAAFAVADSLGLYLQIECSSWANSSTTLGDGKAVDKWLYDEACAIIKAYGNHPSFLLMAYGNEPGGPRHVEYLRDWLIHWKREEPRRLHTCAAGWPTPAENDCDVIPDPRIQGWFEQLRSRINLQPPNTTADYTYYVESTPRPIVSHEIGQWCVYPDFSEIPKYTGVVKAKNFEIFRESLGANHMGDQAAQFVQASGKLQVLCYREDIESALRTRGFGGYQVLQANDFPGQGTALVGWLNPFWESKGYTTPEEFRRFNNSTVLLARLDRRSFSTRDTLRAEIEVAHFGAAPLENARPYWKLVNESGQTVHFGELPAKTLPVDNGIALGKIELSLSSLATPAKYRLVVGLTDTAFENDWEVWVYSAKRNTGSKIPVTPHWETLLQAASNEEKILFAPAPEVRAEKVQLGFGPIFWNTLWTRGQAPHTLGILCDPNHPVFAKFPTEFHTNWQWWELIEGATALQLDGLPPKLRPLVQVIDDWFTNRRLGLIYEARLGNCKLLVTGIDLFGSLPWRHVAHQLRASLLDYMETDAFNPQLEIDAAALRRTLGYSRT